MRRFNTLSLLSVMLLALGYSCTPEDNEMPELNLDSSELNFTVTQDPSKDNDVTLESNDENAIPYWSYYDSNGEQLGRSKNRQESIVLPFAGTYTVQYTAYTQGGPVEAEPVEIEVSNNDAAYFDAPEWEMLTNGVEGKTWVLDMASPIGWAGFDFPYNENGDDYWNWYPDYQGNQWVMEDKDWGEMTFNLDGGYNVSVTQTAINSDEQTTSQGTFNYNLEEHTMNFNGGVELLFGGDYYGDVSDWTSINVINVSENSLRLAVVRDQDRDGEDDAQIIYHYKPKE